MKIGIFGGSFNPPHIGHVKAAFCAYDQCDLDLLLVIPAGVPPHKSLPDSTPDPEMRLLMTKNAFEAECSADFANLDKYNIEISDIEIHSQVRNYTIDTISKIKNKYPQTKLYLLVGTDMYNTIDTWKDSESLLNEVTAIELPRDVIPISSSELRELLKERKGKEYIAGSNYALIIENRLYDAKPDWDWLREKAFSMLDPLRVPHVVACEKEAQSLAERWGVNSDDAREAAILHDITKKLDFYENMCIISKHGLSTDMLGINDEKLLHSITGALIAQSTFGVSESVAEAIKWHTTGKAGMSTLEKVIYIADYIEETRNLPHIDELRRLAYTDINRAMLMGLEMTVEDLVSRGISPDTTTIEAINDFKRITSHQQ